MSHALRFFFSLNSSPLSLRLGLQLLSLPLCLQLLSFLSLILESNTLSFGSFSLNSLSLCLLLSTELLLLTLKFLLSYKLQLLKSLSLYFLLCVVLSTLPFALCFSFSFFIGYPLQSLFFIKPLCLGSCLGSLLLKPRSLYISLCSFPLFDLFLSKQEVGCC